MKKILVIGSSGVGKTTFSQRLGETTGIEVVHLDRLNFSPNWVGMPKAEWREKVAEITQGDSWIIDGNYSGTLEMRIAASDTVIFLEMPRLVCVCRILKRAVVYYGETRPDMAEDCNEKFDWDFVKWVWNYPRRTKPKVEALLKKFQNEKTIIRLASKKQVENFFADFSLDAIKSF